MLVESMPKCVCGVHSWKGGGGYCGPGMSYTCFTCTECGRMGWAFEGHGCLGTVFNGNGGLIETYVNEVMMPTWRAAEAGRGDSKEFVRCVPPKLPAGVDVFLRTGERQRKDSPGTGWEHVTWLESQELEVPPDPIKERHDALWAEIMGELQIAEFTIIENQYDGTKAEPWFQVLMNNKTVTFGPRKRVLNLTVKAGTAFDVEALSEMAKRDDTSYWADGGWHDHDRKVAKEVTVHAWGKEKFVEYFRAVLS